MGNNKPCKAVIHTTHGPTVACSRWTYDPATNEVSRRSKVWFHQNPGEHQVIIAAPNAKPPHPNDFTNNTPLDPTTLRTVIVSTATTGRRGRALHKNRHLTANIDSDAVKALQYSPYPQDRAAHQAASKIAAAGNRLAQLSNLHTTLAAAPWAATNHQIAQAVKDGKAAAIIAATPTRFIEAMTQTAAVNPQDGIDFDIVTQVAQALHKAGHRAYLVGGPVRDLLAGQLPKDLDICSDATPQQFRAAVATLDASVFDVGEEHGTTGMVFTRPDGTTVDIEHTTFRTEVYEDANSRRPTVAFGQNLHEDLARRDFTVNAMALDLITGQLDDPHNGAQALTEQQLDTPDDPVRTFKEDPLRIMRAVRFAAVRDMEVADRIVAAAHEVGDRLQVISTERIRSELDKVLTAGPQAFHKAVQVADQLAVGDKAFFGLNHTRAADAELDRLHDREDLLALLSAVSENAATILADATFTNKDVSGATRTAAATNTLDDSFDRTAARRLVRTHGIENSERIVRVAAALTKPAAAIIEIQDVLATEADTVTAALPVTGHDALQADVTGPNIGKWLAEVETVLCQEGSIDRQTALQLLDNYKNT